jgi:hypothetical protein
VTDTDYSRWFRDHLQSSADGFVWGARQAPAARWDVVPPDGLGEWTAARHVFHMFYYEQYIALPSMKQWLGAPMPSLDSYDEDAAWSTESHDRERLLAAFTRVRAEQIDLLPELQGADWLARRGTVWAPVPLLWVVSKTFQHTAEHTNDILRIALFWDPPPA